jgi:hypothetical protein
MPHIDDANLSNGPSALTIDRRSLLAKGGALAAASVVATGIASPVLAAVTADDAGIRTMRGAYALDGGVILHGFMAKPARIVAPHKGGEIDVVVVLGANGYAYAAAEASALHYAKAGYFAIAPDLHATFGGNGNADPATLREKIRMLAPMIGDLPRGNGNVRFVTV